MDLEKFAVIVAGGSGTRMNSQIPKQFLRIQGKPIIYYTVKTFLDSYPDLIAIVLLPKEYLDKGEELLEGLDQQRVRFLEGGNSRFHSVKNGLQLIPQGAIVFIHDGVRCMVSSTLIHRCYDAAIQYGNAIPAIHATDSIRLRENNGNKSIDRDQVFMIQTPQTFRSEIILPAFEQEYSPLFTDEASVAELYGEVIHLVEGEHQNIKVTRPIDLFIVEYWMKGAAPTS